MGHGRLRSRVVAVAELLLPHCSSIVTVKRLHFWRGSTKVMSLRVANSLFSHQFRRDWINNLAGTSFQDSLCSPEVDVVYTWVNGTDPWLMKGAFELEFSARGFINLCFSFST